MRFFALLFAVLAWSSQAEATVFDPSFKLSQITDVDIKLMDGAKGACWTNLKEVREYAEEKLRMKGVKVVEKRSPFDILKSYRFEISVLSNRIYEGDSGPCYGNVSINLHAIGKINEHFIIGVVGETSHIVLTEKNLNRKVINYVSKFIAEFK